jgi:hypothetical protein
MSYLRKTKKYIIGWINKKNKKKRILIDWLKMDKSIKTQPALVNIFQINHFGKYFFQLHSFGKKTQNQGP